MTTKTKTKTKTKTPIFVAIRKDGDGTWALSALPHNRFHEVPWDLGFATAREAVAFAVSRYGNPSTLTNLSPEDAVVVCLQCEERPEYYYGEATGQTTSYVRATGWEDNRYGGIAGRSTRGPKASVSEWNLRAKEDGHDVIGVLLAKY